MFKKSLASLILCAYILSHTTIGFTNTIVTHQTLASQQGESVEKDYVAEKENGFPSATSLDPVTEVKRVWNAIDASIKKSDPYVATKKAPFLSRLHRGLKRTFEDMEAKVASGAIDPFVNFQTLNSGEKAFNQNLLHDSNEEITVGFLGIAGNPTTWGHMLIAFMSNNIAELDTTVMRVQGEIGYKKLSDTERVPTKARHDIMQTVIKNKGFPFLRYTDLGSEPNNEDEAFESMLKLLQLKGNQNRKLHMVYLIGIEKKARVLHYTRLFYEMVIKHNFGTNPNHRISIGWIQRDNPGESFSLDTTQKEMNEINEEIRKDVGATVSLPVKLIKDPLIDLQVTSTYYRNSRDPAIMPEEVDAWAKEGGYYGHPPIDPMTGKPYDYSEEDMFRLKLRPIAEGIANQSVLKVEQKGNKGDVTLLVGLDGPSGSGKTTICEEVEKYLHPRGYETVQVNTDYFLKNRSLRSAVERYVNDDPEAPMTEKDWKLFNEWKREMVATGKITEDQIKRGEPFLLEEEFWDNEALQKAMDEIVSFIQSGKETYDLVIKNAYIRNPDAHIPEEGALVCEKGTYLRKNGVYIREKDGQTDITIPLKKGSIILAEGKYMLQEAFQKGYYDLFYRLTDSPDRTEAKFEMRTRTLRPNSADQQMHFYHNALMPSYLAYVERVGVKYNGEIDVSGKEEEWKLTLFENGHKTAEVSAGKTASSIIESNNNEINVSNKILNAA